MLRGQPPRPGQRAEAPQQLDEGLQGAGAGLAPALAQQVDAPMPLGSHCVPLWNDAEKTLGANADHTEIVRVLERITGTELR